MKQRRRFRKIAILAILIFMTLPVALIVGGVIYLRSPSASEKILSLAKEYLRTRMNLNLDYSEGHLNPFSGFHFKNLRIVRNGTNSTNDGTNKDANGTLFVSIDFLDLDYTFSLWQRRLEVHRLQIIHPTIRMHAPASTGTTPPSQSPDTENSSSSGIEKLRAFIENPPIRMRINEFIIENLDLDLVPNPNLNIDLSSTSAPAGNHLRLKDFNLKFDLNLHKGQLSSHGEFRTGNDPVLLAATMATTELVTNARAQATTSGRWGLDIRREEDQWLYELTPADFALHLRDVSVLKMLKALKTGNLPKTIGSSTSPQPNQPSTHLEIPSARFDADLKIVARTRELFAIDRSSFQIADTRIEAKIDSLTLDQTTLGPQHLLWTSRLDQNSRLHQKTNDTKHIQTKYIQAEIDATIERIRTRALPPSRKPPRLTAKGSIVLAPDLTSTQIHLQTDLENMLRAEVTGEGRWHPAPKGSGTLELTEIAPPKKANSLPARLNQPVSLSYRFDLTPNRNTVDVTGDFPSLTVPALGILKETRFNVSARSPNLPGARDIDITLDLSLTEAHLAKPLPGSMPHPSGLTAKTRASLRDGRRLTFDSLELELRQPALRLEAQANGDVVSKNLQAKSNLSFQLSDLHSPLAGQTFQGRISIPVALSVLQGRDVNVAGFIDLDRVAWSKKSVGASGITGRIAFSEKLKWDGESLRFTHLIVQNPFERVDFERVRPFLNGTEQLRIERLNWEEKSYGPLIGFFSIHQNMLFAHQFDLDLGKGRTYGQFFFDAHPSNLQVGVLSRITNLDLNELLPHRFLKRMPAGDKKLSARAGLVIGLNRGSMDGRVDITEIGGPQLIAAMNVLDPNYEDEKINKVRNLLELGYPTAVELAFADGYMNMEIALSILGVAKTQSLTGVPVSSLLTTATADLVKQTEKGPLR